MSEGNGIDFYIHKYYTFEAFGVELSITTTHVCMVLVMAIIMVFALFANRAVRKADPNKVPGSFLNFIELLVELVDGMVTSSMGPKYGPKYANYIGSLFVFILICNLSGFLGLRSPTADWGFTLPLGLISFFMIQYAGIRYQKWGRLKELSKPLFIFFPINVIAELSRPVTLSLRLFGNIVSGTILLALVYGLLPTIVLLAWPAFVHAYLDIMPGLLQTYVFCILTQMFVASAIGEEA